MSEPPLVCLITPGHLASTPRLLKEADALVAAGYRVHVVAGRHYQPADPLDTAILKEAQWSCTRVDARTFPAAFARKLFRRFARAIISRTGNASLRIAACAQHAESIHLSAVSSKIPAQLYIGHCLAGLSAAALAAHRRNVPYGFDAEDFHDWETFEIMRSKSATTAGRILQSQLLPACVHLTAASPLIAETLQRHYHVTARVLLNVFPRAMAPLVPVDPGPISSARPARLYWFSQTIGPGRGLEPLLAALGRMHVPAELHLRGFVAPDYAAQLQRLAAGVGSLPLCCHPPAPAAEMARLAASADLGLSIEESAPPNRDLCLTNKIFIYLLAGIPQLLSNTTAQQSLAPALGNAALLADIHRPSELAQRLDIFLSNPAAMAQARQFARQLSQSRYCWDIEQEVFLASVKKALS